MSRKSRQRKRGVLGFVSIRVMAEYECSGLWRMQPVGPFRHCGIGYDALRVPTDLKARFRQWIEIYRGYYEASETFDIEAFNQTGRELAHLLKAHLGSESYVEFVPESSAGGSAAEVIV